MYLFFDTMVIHLQSDGAVINQQWRQWGAERLTPVAAAAPTADICLQLALVDNLPPLLGSPLFIDNHPLPDDVGRLSVYPDDDETVLLSYRNAAQVRVPLYSSPPARSLAAAGVINRQAIRYGRLEHISYTSLAPLLRRRGIYLLHAFAAGQDGTAVLIVGPPGSGKTTAGLSLVLAGRQLLANDVVLLTERRDGIYAWPTPGAISVKAATLALLPELRPFVNNSTAIPGRFDVAMPQWDHGRWSDAHRVTAVYFPQIADHAQTLIRPYNRALSLAHLMEASMDRWDKTAVPAHISFLQKASRQATPYQLQLGADIQALPALLPEKGTY